MTPDFSMYKDFMWLFLAPRGTPVPAQVYNQNDGTVRVEYQVQEVGRFMEFNSMNRSNNILGMVLAAYISTWI